MDCLINIVMFAAAKLAIKAGARKAAQGAVKAVSKGRQLVASGKQLVAKHAAAQKRRRMMLTPGTSSSRAEMNARLGLPANTGASNPTAAQRLANMKNVDVDVSLANAKRVNKARQDSQLASNMTKTRNQRQMEVNRVTAQRQASVKQSTRQIENPERQASRVRFNDAPQVRTFSSNVPTKRPPVPPKSQQRKTIWTREFDDPTPPIPPKPSRLRVPRQTNKPLPSVPTNNPLPSVPARAQNFRTNMMQTRGAPREAGRLPTLDEPLDDIKDEKVRQLLKQGAQPTPYARQLGQQPSIRGAGRRVPFAEQRAANRGPMIRNLGTSRGYYPQQPPPGGLTRQSMAPPNLLSQNFTVRQGDQLAANQYVSGGVIRTRVPKNMANQSVPRSVGGGGGGGRGGAKLIDDATPVVGSSDTARLGQSATTAATAGGKNGALKAFFGFELLDTVGDIANDVQQNQAISSLAGAVAADDDDDEEFRGQGGGPYGGFNQTYNPTNVIYNTNTQPSLEDDEEQPYILANPNYTQMPWN